MTAPDGRSAPRSRAFFRVRVAVLLFILAGVLLYAWTDRRRRRERNDWQRTLTVGLIVVRELDRGEPIDDAIYARLRDRVPALEAQLASEAKRHGVTEPRPFQIEVYGPVDAGAPPPPPSSDGFLDLARYAYEKWRITSRIDKAAKVDTRGLDARIYVYARKGHLATPSFVEGLSEEGGRSGIVSVDLDGPMIDFALSVFAHELFHTLGAVDKYDASGATLIPAGLAEPSRVPMFPQRYVEIMARARPLSLGHERSIDRLEELRVGDVTAREIGWPTGAIPEP